MYVNEIGFNITLIIKNALYLQVCVIITSHGDALNLFDEVSMKVTF